jgi:hypothetical protein
VEQPLVQIAVPGSVRVVVHGPHGDLDLFAFEMGECRIMLAREPMAKDWELRWHLSISCVDRHPTWDEIKTARYRLLGPDTVMAMVLPKAEHYVNYTRQDHVFQLLEIVDEGEPWRAGM